jgi:ribosomal protein L11 methyltransferase
LAGLEPQPLAVSRFIEPNSDRWVIEALYAEKPDSVALAGACRTHVPAWTGQIALDLIPDANWVAVSQAALPPITVGPFLVHGSHDRHAALRRRWSIQIDANEAFGTAHHASTRGCLVAIARLARRVAFRHVLDLGCGSGILAFAAAHALPCATVMASDMDPRAIAVARANARLNRLGGRVEFVVAQGLSHALLRRARFDLVLANILAAPLMRLAPRLAPRVLPGGCAVVSGLLEEEAQKVTAAYVAAGFVRIGSLTREGWTTLLLQHRPLRGTYSQ